MAHISKAAFVTATEGVQWRNAAPPDDLVYPCDAPGCDEEADTVHFLPTVTTAKKVLFGCHQHDPGGYWVELKGFWTDGPPDMKRPGERYTSLRHIMDKPGGEEAIKLLLDRIEDARALSFEQDEDRLFDAQMVIQALIIKGDANREWFRPELLLP